MGTVILIVILAIVLANQLFLSWVLIHIEQWLAVLCGLEDEEVPEQEAKVTDPFQKPAPVHSSTNHIIVPKTPTEIRNQNFKKIKDGIEYGDIAQR